MTDSTCGIDGCDKPRVGRWCVMHYKRIRRHGSPDVRLKTGPPKGTVVIEDPDYYAFHKRLAAARGPAKTHTCSCGKPAEQWAYVGPREAGDRMPFSLDMTEYEPMCTSCHKNMDLEKIREKEFHP